MASSRQRAVLFALMAEKLPVVGNTSSCVLGMSHRF